MANQNALYSEETVRAIISDPRWNDNNALFRAVPFKALSDQVLIRY